MNLFIHQFKFLLMKVTTLSIAALLCVSLSYAQEKNINNNILPTSFGSFGTIKLEGQTESEVKPDKVTSVDVKDMQYKHSSIKTSDGGTATFVKFNTKKIQALAVPPVKKSPIPNTAKNTNKED